MMKTKTLLTAVALIWAGTSVVLGSGQENASLQFSEEAGDFDMVSDRSGTLHAIVARPVSFGSELRHYSKSGEDWVLRSEISSTQGADQIYGIDLEVDRAGRLHATYYVDENVVYSSFLPGEAVWQSETVAAGVAPRSDRRPFARTSVTMRGENPVMVYAKDGPGGRPAGVYGVRGNSGWQSSDIIPTGETQAILGFFPVISNGGGGNLFSSAIPNYGTTVAYFENGSYWLTELSTSIGIGGSTSTWSAPVEIGSGPATELAPGFYQLDMKIIGTTAHLLFRGESPDGSVDGGVYCQRTRLIGGGTQLIYENVTETPGNGFGTATLALTPGNIPAVSFSKTLDGNSLVFFNQRAGDDVWDEATFYSAPVNAGNNPTGTALAFDPFGRPAVMVSRQDGRTALSVQDVDFDLSSEFIISAGLGIFDTPQSALAVDGSGRVGFVYEGSGGGSGLSASLLTCDPSLENRRFDSLDLDIPEDATNRVLLTLDMATLGQDESYVLTQVRFTSPGAVPITTIRLVLHRFVRGFGNETTTLWEFSDLAVPSFVYNMTSDGEFLYIRNVTSGTTEVRDGLENLNEALTEEINQAIPNDLLGAVFSAKGGGIAAIGKRNDRLVLVHRGRNQQWRSRRLTDTGMAPLSGRYDVDVDGTSAVAVFHDGTSFRVAESLITDSATITLPNVRAANLVGDYDVRISRDTTGDVHLVTKDRANGTVGHFIYDGFPDDTGFSARSVENVAIVEDLLLTDFDPIGYPVLLGTDTTGGGLGMRRLFRSPLTIDRDGDGLPFFMELALCRDPEVSDNTGILRMENLTRQLSGHISGAVSYDRLSGEASSRGTSVGVGKFRYSVEVSRDLENPAVFFPASILNFSSASTPNGNGLVRQSLGFTPDFNSPSAIFPKLFFRVKVALR